MRNRNYYLLILAIVLIFAVKETYGVFLRDRIFYKDSPNGQVYNYYNYWRYDKKQRKLIIDPVKYQKFMNTKPLIIIKTY